MKPDWWNYLRAGSTLNNSDTLNSFNTVSKWTVSLLKTQKIESESWDFSVFVLLWCQRSVLCVWYLMKINTGQFFLREEQRVSSVWRLSRHSERRFLNCRVQQSSFKQDKLEAAAEPSWAELSGELEVEEAEQTEAWTQEPLSLRNEEEEEEEWGGWCVITDYIPTPRRNLHYLMSWKNIRWRLFLSAVSNTTEGIQASDAGWEFAHTHTDPHKHRHTHI